MDLVENERASRFQHPPSAFAGQQNVKRLRRGDNDVRRTLRHRGAFSSGRVAGANQGANVYLGQAEGLEFRLNSLQRDLEISLHVIAESFQWRDVDDVGGVV